jgi:hypothetical protein
MKTYTVFEVLADGAGDGPACDGTFVHRFRKLADAQRFAARSTCYGKPATVSDRPDVSRRLMERWGMV